MSYSPLLEYIIFFTVLLSSCGMLDSSTREDNTGITESEELFPYQYSNPVLQESVADPSIIKGKDGFFYLFSTETGKFPNVPIFKSKDLVKWSFVRTAFTDITRPRSFEGNIWAPDINYIEGKYVLYYSMSRWGGEQDCGIGVAVSDSPYGPFVDYAKLFDSREIGVQNSIDPFFIEEEGNKYLFWGSLRGIYGILLGNDGLSVANDAVKFKIAGQGGEGTYIHKHNGEFFLFISTGSCCNGLSSTYKVMMGKANNLTGPFFDQQGRNMLDSQGSLFLQANSYVIGPGHNSEFITDDNGEDWVLYHGYLREKPSLNRILFLDRVCWDNGWPRIIDQSPSVLSEKPFFKTSSNE